MKSESSKIMHNHFKTQALIPWYVNGTLDEQDMTVMAEHLGACASCKAEVANAMEQARIIHLGDDDIPLQLLGGKVENFARLKQKIRQRGRSTTFNLPASRLIPAIAATVLTAALLGTMLGGWLSENTARESTFQTMTSQGGSEIAVLQIIFHPQTSEHDIRMMLIDSGGELLGSPTAKGVYRMAITGVDDPASYAVRLRLHPSIRWAEIEQ